MKRSCILLALLFPPLCALADGEEWRADLAADSVHNVYLRRGDATTLRAELYVRGRAYLPSTAVAKYRTNLVDRTWLQAPAVIASNTVSFAWMPFLAPDADVVPFVFYIDGEVYRASAMIYLRASPDAGSDEARAVLDLDAYDITNAPWATPGDLAAAIGSIEFPEPDYSSSNAALVATIQAVAPAPGNYETVSNRAMAAVQTETDPVFATWLGADPLATYAPTGHVHASVVAGNTTLAAVPGGTATVAHTWLGPVTVLSTVEVSFSYPADSETRTGTLSAGTTFKGPFGPFSMGVTYYVPDYAPNPTSDAEATSDWSIWQAGGDWYLMFETMPFAPISGMETPTPTVGEWQFATSVTGTAEMGRTWQTDTNTLATVEQLNAAAVAATNYTDSTAISLVEYIVSPETARGTAYTGRSRDTALRDGKFILY